MATLTENLGLGLGTLGDYSFKKGYRDNLALIDTTIGDLAGVTTIDGDSVAEKLAALETRLAALE